MPALLARFKTDRESLERTSPLACTPEKLVRMQRFYEEWQGSLASLPQDGLTHEDRADVFLFGNLLQAELKRLDRAKVQFGEAANLIPFSLILMKLETWRRNLDDVDPQQAAEGLSLADEALSKRRKELEESIVAGTQLPRPAVAMRAANFTDQIQKYLVDWYAFYSGYDPLFTWWCEKPYQSLDRSLKRYARFLKRKVAGAEDKDAIIGDPIGREALLEELSQNLIPYSPEELMEIARREREWCIAEAVKAANEMGWGDDWRAAIEKVKQLHVEPGKQTALVRDLAREAERYLAENDLVTVPSLAEETWRMSMMSPDAQKVNPFFLGGEVIQVSYPTNTMDHSFKRMSLRGNNRHFSRATVQHELIPGHHLQFFNVARNRPYRQIFETPFWTEGWTIHWEFLLYERGFPQSPEDRIGMLFWRLHRCARVIFSLAFHLGEMTPQDCVEMLVNEVGHERENALGEVRRSFGGDYDPLYQCGYLIGGLQVHALYKEMVGSGKMTDREFHDRIMAENFMPIAVLRGLMMGGEFDSDWRFYSL